MNNYMAIKWTNPINVQSPKIEPGRKKIKKSITINKIESEKNSQQTKISDWKPSR